MISSLTPHVLALLAPVHWIVEVLKPVLIFFHDSVGVGWGMSIVLLTVCVRALLAPLTVKQFKSMQSMVRVAPELKALQAKHKDDKQRQQQEVMKFYADNKINPFASCLPLVAQMPFFIGLFYLLRTDLRFEICGKAAVAASKTTPCAHITGSTAHGAESFLFVPDLTVKATGWVLAVLIVLYVSSQLLSSILTPSSADRNQRMLMYGLPFVFVFFVINFPAGLIVYWITTNLWTVTQGWVLRRRLGPVVAPAGASAVAVAGAPGDSGGRGGGFMARLSAVTGQAAAASSPSSGGDDPPAKKEGRSSSSGASLASTKPKAVSKEREAPASSPKPRGRARLKSAEASPEPAAAKPSRNGPPPPPPRKKKKRSGRRR